MNESASLCVRRWKPTICLHKPTQVAFDFWGNLKRTWTKKQLLFVVVVAGKSKQREKRCSSPPLLLHQRRLLCKCFILKRATSRFEQELHECLQVQNHKQLESQCFYTVSILMFSFQFILHQCESYILSQCVFERFNW